MHVERRKFVELSRPAVLHFCSNICLLGQLFFSSTVLADKTVAGARVLKLSEWKLETDKIPRTK